MKEIITKTGLEIKKELMNNIHSITPDEITKKIEYKLYLFAEEIKKYYENKVRGGEVKTMEKDGVNYCIVCGERLEDFEKIVFEGSKMCTECNIKNLKIII